MTDIELIDHLLNHPGFKCKVVVEFNEIIGEFHEEYPGSDLFVALIKIGRKFYLLNGNKIVFKREGKE